MTKFAFLCELSL